MHLVTLSEGMALFMKLAHLLKRKISLTKEEHNKCSLLLTFAHEQFKFVLKSITDSVHTLLHLAKVIHYLACYYHSPGAFDMVLAYLGKEHGKALTHQLTSSHGADTQRNSGGTGRGGSANTNKLNLLNTSLKHYEQAINILKKCDAAAALLAQKSSGSHIIFAAKMGGQHEQEDNECRNKNQIDIDQDLLCIAVPEMVTILCKLSIHTSALTSHKGISSSGSGTTILRERRRIWV
jgi:hypothetical protein